MTTKAEKISLLEERLSVLSDTMEERKKLEKPPSAAGTIFSIIALLFLVGLFFVAWGPIGLISVLALATTAMFILRATGIIKGRYPLLSIAYIIILIATGIFVISIIFSLSVPGIIMLLIIIIMVGGTWHEYKKNHKVPKT